MSTISKNILWSSATSLLQVYTGSVVFIVLAKLMSLEDFGILSFGFSLAAILVICADFGFSLMIMKDFPRYILDHKKYVSNSLFSKVLISIFVSVFAIVYLCLLYDKKWLKVGGLYMLFAVVSSFVVYFQSLLKVQNKFHKYTETTIIYAIGVTVVVLIYWFVDTGLVMLAFYLLICRVLQLLWSTYLCRKSFNIRAFDINMQKSLFKNSWSFGLHTVLGIFYFMIDTQIISIYLGAKEVALYQAVFRIVLVLLIASEMLSNVLLPYLSFKYAKGENIASLVSRLLLYLIILGCSMFLLFTSFGSFIIQFLYTEEYLFAVPLVAPLSIVIIIRTVCSLLGNILTISDRQVYRVITVFVSLIASVVLNFILIPKYGIIAAAWSSVLVHICMFGMYLFYSKKEIKGIKLFSVDSILVLISAVLIFFGVKLFSSEGILIHTLAIVFWLIGIFFIMKRNENFNILLRLLKDKGV
ncbi:flippase [Thalassobellus suaedae]|uniref:Flippase n=1 Tax=Thalassobellus suaedae TaxID=3074124 RepID=A0ABY9Y6V8_9FLAO|nr:flippase [Flavobacteriaceae bacterium HL-DH10]